jgi:hypothetical protein
LTVHGGVQRCLGGVHGLNLAASSKVGQILDRLKPTAPATNRGDNSDGWTL